MSLEIKRLSSVLEKGAFCSEVSEDAKNALESSIDLRAKHKTKKSPKTFSLDFTEVNKVAIEKRGNLKVYQNLPKGIRVVAR